MRDLRDSEGFSPTGPGSLTRVPARRARRPHASAAFPLHPPNLFLYTLMGVSDFFRTDSPPKQNKKYVGCGNGVMEFAFLTEQPYSGLGSKTTRNAYHRT